MPPMDTIAGNTAIEFDAPGVVPGTITRSHPCVEPLIFDADDGPVAFGAAYKLDADSHAVAFEANDLADDVDGFVVRNVPSMAPNSDADTEDFGTPHPGKPQGGLVRGSGRNYMAALCAQGTPKRRGKVYIRRVANAPLVVGGLEADHEGVATAGAMAGTGDATVGGITVDDSAEIGVNTVLMTAATKFNVQTPSGVVLKQGTLGAAYSAGGLGFTVTAGGTPAVAGDTIAITVVQKNVPMAGVTWAIDGKDANNRTEIRIQ